ncbi:subclass B1 metallo-beta-lactamase [Hyphococcus sp.]|uniref:subclass B1 metallo-beta-lactamase n=1 Tax=Hyphococcus sp. TaxID=2038636 RepID=UPI0035C7532F
MLRNFTALLAALCIASCASTPETQQAENRLPEPSLEQIADNVWIHKSYHVVEPWGPILSQGMVIETDKGVILVDTAWTDEETESLLNLIAKETGELPIQAIVTHAHSDKMGGMDALHAHEIVTIAHQFSNEDAPARSLTPARTSIEMREKDNFIATAPDSSIVYEILYPGPGHTRDNIVVYYAPAKVLFGGCLIRPGDSDNLGNTADGDVGHWAQATRNVAEAFPDAEIVIPSHGPMGGRALLDHTIALAEKAAAAQ